MKTLTGFRKALGLVLAAAALGCDVPHEMGELQSPTQGAGTQTSAASGFLPTVLTPHAGWVLDTGDLDGDGHLDVVASPPGPATILFGNGDGSFRTVDLGAAVLDVRVGDFDADGRPDLVAVYLNDPNYAVFMLRNQGSGAFASPGVSLIATGIPVGMVAADLDGDGDLDLAVNTHVVTGTGELQLYYNDGTGVFARREAVPSGAFPSGLAAGDLDGDGVAELVSLEKSQNQVLVFRRASAGAWASTAYAVRAVGDDIAVADVDGDGHRDVVLVTEGVATTFLGRGDGSLGPGRETDLRAPAVSRAIQGGLAVADFDGDGRADVAFGLNSDGFASLTLALGGSGGSFTAVPVQQPSAPPGPLQIRGSASADLNGDRKADLLLNWGDFSLGVQLAAP